jgi:hypothetical protein
MDSLCTFLEPTFNGSHRMSRGFVGTQTLDSSAALVELLQDLQKSLPAHQYSYFLRWVHRVAWAETAPSVTTLSPEGEMLTPDYELRWQASGQGYEVLLLAAGKPPTTQKFTPMALEWQVSDPLPALLLPTADAQDARYPQNLTYPSKLQLEQRYFQHRSTGTVHFVARTLAG